MKIGDTFYSVRELSPYKKSLNKAMLELSQDHLEVLAKQYGAMLANAHVRSSRKG